MAGGSATFRTLFCAEGEIAVRHQLSVASRQEPAVRGKVRIVEKQVLVGFILIDPAAGGALASCCCVKIDRLILSSILANNCHR